MRWEWDTDKNIVDDLSIPFFGKKIGILGHDDGGKTVLTHLIKKKELKPSSGSTDLPEKEKAIKVTFEQRKGSQRSVLIKVMIDTPGDKAKSNTRKKVFKEQDYIIYFVRSDLILAHNSSISPTEEINRQRASAKNSLKQYLSNFQAWVKS